MINERLHKKIQDWVTKLEQFADRAWYGPLIGFLAALDAIILVIPNDGILVASTMLVPRRWIIFAVCVAVGSSLGAIALNYIVEIQGLPFILEYYPGLDQTYWWKITQNFFDQYGILIVFAVGASPIMQQPAIVLAALANTPVTQLATAIFLGRILKFLLMAYLASHSPKVLKRIWGLKGELKDAGVKLD